MRLGQRPGLYLVLRQNMQTLAEYVDGIDTTGEQRVGDVYIDGESLRDEPGSDPHTVKRVLPGPGKQFEGKGRIQLFNAEGVMLRDYQENKFFGKGADTENNQIYLLD